MSTLARIAYVSSTRREVPHEELDALLAIWRRQNADRGVTGFLLYHRESVFQLLEGPAEVIQELYSTIAHDPRHHFVAKLIDEPIEARDFGEWPMGHGRVAHSDLAALGTLRPFLDPRFCYWHCDQAMAREIVGEFAHGPWRRSIG